MLKVRYLTPGMSFDSIALVTEGQMRKTETLNLRVSTEFKRRLVEESKKEKRSVTNYIESALSQLWSLKAAVAIRDTKLKRRS